MILKNLLILVPKTIYQIRTILHLTMRSNISPTSRHNLCKYPAEKNLSSCCHKETLLVNSKSLCRSHKNKEEFYTTHKLNNTGTFDRSF